MHNQNSFITLTYREEDLPSDGSLVLEHFQNFMKRLRWHSGEKIRFFHCGEYGEDLKRPHYHAILFGYQFPDLEHFATNHQGQPLYRSKTAEKIWQKGWVTIGEATWQSAAYVARYIFKKQKGESARDHYWTEPDEDGVITTLKPEYVTMSRRPGIGLSWLKKYWTDIYPKDYLTINGKKFAPPRYYDKWLKDHHPEIMEDVIIGRIENAERHAQDFTDERLRDREYVQQKNVNDKLLRNKV